MKKSEFIKVLKSKGYKYELKGMSINVIHERNIYLDNLTTLPENTKFENKGHVYLNNLTTLPENAKFENKGHVYLDSLTTLPENVKFENGGYVDLRSLTTLPENVKFENKGHVYLNNLTTLPENTKFENKGHVYLDSLTTLPENVKVVDNYGMKVNSSKQVGEYTIFDCNYLGNNKHSYVAQRGETTAHGKTVKKAIEDCNFKYQQQNLDVSDIVSRINRDNKVTVQDYRLLTGACQQGCENFLKSNKIISDEFTIEEAINLTKNQYGSNEFSKLLN